MASVTLKNVFKEYEKGIRVVSDFSLEVRDKEFIVLVGPSGCGKSTTLRMIAGLEEITGGEIYIGGKMVNNLEPKNRDIAMVFQNYALYPHMSVYENMALSLKIRRIPKKEIKRKVEETARMLDLTAYLKRKPRSLSGGQRQRVALGRAIVREPKVFLLDEPLSNLDAKLRAQMRTEIIKTHQKLGTTFIFVTHDQTEAMTMASRIVVMKDGIIQQIDAPQRLYDHPKNLFVAGFIGSPQMNLFDAVLNLRESTFTLEFAGYSFQLPEPMNANPVLANYTGKTILLGFRPEDISLHDGHNGKTGGAAMEARVDVMEQMGAESFLYLTVQNQEMIARIPAGIYLEPGSTTTLSLDIHKIHLFDKETEESILFTP